MQISITRAGRSPVVRLTVLMGLLTWSLFATGPVSAPGPASGLVPVAEVVEAADPGAVVGRIPWSKFGCFACAGMLIGLGGGSVVGIAAMLSAVPEYGFWCAVGCYAAFR